VSLTPRCVRSVARGVGSQVAAAAQARAMAVLLTRQQGGRRCGDERLCRWWHPLPHSTQCQFQTLRDLAFKSLQIVTNRYKSCQSPPLQLPQPNRHTPTHPSPSHAPDGKRVSEAAGWSVRAPVRDVSHINMGDEPSVTCLRWRSNRWWRLQPPCAIVSNERKQ
jgi:hypothetical protein